MTIVSIIRLIYLVKGIHPQTFVTLDYIYIWICTFVEINVSIICGQYKSISLLLCIARNKLSNIQNVAAILSMSALSPPSTIVHVREAPTAT